MSDIFKYVYFEGDFSHMANMADGEITYKDDNPWCKYSDVKPLEERIKELEAMTPDEFKLDYLKRIRVAQPKEQANAHLS